MKRSAIILAAMLLLFTLGSCKHEEGDAPNYVFPLQIGNSWEMIHSVHAPDIGNMEDGVLRDTMMMMVESEAYTPDNEACMKVNYYFKSNPNDVAYEYLVNRSDGLYLLGWENITGITPFKKGNPELHPGLFSRFVKHDDTKAIVWLETPRLVVPGVCTEGDTWTNQTSEDILPASYTLLTPSSVETGCGTLYCITRKTEVFAGEDVWTSYDYYSAKGLAKFRIDFTTEMFDEDGNYLGTFDGYEQLLLNDCELN